MGRTYAAWWQVSSRSRQARRTSAGSEGCANHDCLDWQVVLSFSSHKRKLEYRSARANAARARESPPCAFPETKHPQHMGHTKNILYYSASIALLQLRAQTHVVVKHSNQHTMIR